MLLLSGVLPVSKASAQPVKLDVAASNTWWGQVPIMVAIDKGFFKEQGLDIEYQVILNSSDRLASVDAGSSAFSNLGRSSIIPAMASASIPSTRLAVANVVFRSFGELISSSLMNPIRVPAPRAA